MQNMGGRHAVVTGGSSGIGLATALALGRRGSRLTLMARRPELLDAAVGRLSAEGIDASRQSVDVSDRSVVGDAMVAATDERGPVDILVCSPSSADQVASCIPDRATRLLAVGAGLAPGVITRVTDRSVTRARAPRPSTEPGEATA